MINYWIPQKPIDLKECRPNNRKPNYYNKNRK